MDMQICLDFFAVITYITDYYMKDDSGLLPFLREALKENEDGSLKEKLNLVKNTFLVNRQVGESELYYKMFPSLHLAHSNIGVEFVPTGFKEQRSRFIRQITQEEAENRPNVIKVEGKEGKFYVEKSGMLDKYEKCPDALKKILSYSQFVKRYIPSKTCPDTYKFEEDLKANVTEQMEKNGDYIFYGDGTKKLIKLPEFIPLVNTKTPGEFNWMKRRSPKVLRYHKFKQKTEAHQYYYSEMQLFPPFSKEEDLFPSEDEKCRGHYFKNLTKIEYVKSKVLPHTRRVAEARESAENIISEIGDELDPENQLQEDESELEGVQVDPDHYVTDPTGMLGEPNMTAKKDNFRKIEVEKDEVLNEKIRKLDCEQRVAFETVLKYARDHKKATENKENLWPEPPLLLVHGGAGTGKSHVIDVLSQKLQKTFQKEGDNPDQPYIIKTAFTGCAAKIIKGQTLHSIFKFQFNDKIMSLSDKERDKMRLGLQNLKVMIIDEISLVKAEMLYQLHFRLSKEIFQNKLPFGGISVIVFGDIMQIKPVLGSFVFGQVKNQNMQLIQSIDNLWEKFEVVALKTNHRQGKDKDYADLLNRVRIGQHTDEDMDFLKTRVFRTEEAPDNALIVSGTNAKVDKYNTNKLNKQVGKLVS